MSAIKHFRRKMGFLVIYNDCDGIFNAILLSKLSYTSINQM